MPPPPSPNARLDELHPDAAEPLILFAADAVERGFHVYETARTFARQLELYERGVSQVHDVRLARHCLRGALDVTLAELVPGWTEKGFWWTGVEKDPATGRRTVVKDEATLSRWLELGELARGHGLEWGGWWPHILTRKGRQRIGWDFPHVQRWPEADPRWDALPHWETWPEGVARVDVEAILRGREGGGALLAILGAAAVLA